MTRSLTALSMTYVFVLQPMLLVAGPPPSEGGDTSITAFIGPPPGTTYVYHFFRNGVAVEGSETLVKGIAREDGSRIRLQQVERGAVDPSRAPSERTSEVVLRVSEGTLESIGQEGRAAALLSEPLKMGHTWSRTTMEWRPASEKRYPPSSPVTEADLKDGSWRPVVGTCRVEKIYTATLFEKERIVVVVSSSFKTVAGITATGTEEWASGLGMVTAVKSVKDESGRELDKIEKRLVRVLGPALSLEVAPWQWKLDARAMDDALLW